MIKTITVASIEGPKEGKKQGAVIDSTGQRWGVWADKLQNYQQFASYDITFKSNNFQGKVYYTIESATKVGGNGAPTPQRVFTPNVISMPPRDERADQQRRLDIFVCGAFNNILSNPSVNPLELTTEMKAEMVRQLKRVWTLTLGPQPDPISSDHNDDLNDSIPDFA